MPKNAPSTVRIPSKEKVEAMKKAEAYGLPSFTAVIRFALKQLKMPER